MDAGTRLGPYEIVVAIGAGGMGEVYRARDTIQSFPKPGRKWQVSTAGGEQPEWRRDGRELFYLSPKADNQFMAVDILSKPGSPAFEAGVPKELFVLNVVTGPVARGRVLQRNSYQVWKDGQRLLLNSSRAAAGEPPHATVVLNWAAALGTGGSPWR